VPDDVEIVESEDAVEPIVAPEVQPELPPSKDDDFIDEDKDWIRVERMPRLAGCASDELTYDEEYACSETKLMTYIAHNLKYPALARENGIEGKVFVEFVVDKKGDITKVEVVRDIGAGCGAAAKKVVDDMIKNNGFWTPGLQQGRTVKVKYTIPITFKLAN